MDTNNDAATDEFRDWAVSRKAAAATIDVETCELWWVHTQILDPYVLFEAEGRFTDDAYQIGRVFFARSPETDGRVCEYDLSPAQREAMWARVDRGDPDEFDLLSHFLLRLRRRRVEPPLPHRQREVTTIATAFLIFASARAANSRGQQRYLFEFSRPGPRRLVKVGISTFRGPATVLVEYGAFCEKLRRVKIARQKAAHGGRGLGRAA